MLTAKTSARYGLRVFGYLLATTLAAGVVAGLGAGAAYALESDFFTQLPPGDPAADLTALAAFGVGLGLALLVFVAGVIVTLADAVSTGVRAAGSAKVESPETGETAEGPPDDGSAQEPAATDRAERDEGAETPDTEGPADDDFESPPHEQSPAPTPDREESEPMDTDPFAEAAEAGAYDPTDPIDDPHEAQSNPLGEPEDQPTAEEWTSKTPQGEAGDDAAWREEIERKLDDEE